MHKFTLNFRKSARERAAEISTRAYNHYRRFSPVFQKAHNTVKMFRDRLKTKFSK